MSELNAIKADLPPAGAATYGRATAPAADFLLAELYLNAGVYTGTPDYANALASASAVIIRGCTASIPTSSICSRPTTTRHPKSCSP